MNVAHANPVVTRPIRLWPGVVIVVVQWLLWIGVPLLSPDQAIIGILAGPVTGILLAIWWLFFSRAPWIERVGTIILMIVAVMVTRRFVDVSVANGMMGRMLPMFSIPPLSLALVAALAATRYLSAPVRRAAIVVAVVIACGAMTLVRNGGVNGAGGVDLHWRWTPTPEQLLVAQVSAEKLDRPSTAIPLPVPPAATEPSSKAGTPAVAAEKGSNALPAAAAATVADPTPKKLVGDWPGFRGPQRDGAVHGVRIETDWTRAKPIELWRRKIGPGWSSFAVGGDLIYTQEQLGEHEVVSCYKLATGLPVWRHRDSARFYSPEGGAGPRATPALHNGRVYTMGGTGIVNALDARTGAVIWTRNAQADTGAPLPGWGFAGSPLVVEDLVVVATSGRLAAYDIATGNPRWIRPTGGGGYSSPHLATIAGVTQVLLLSGGGGVTSVAPADGAILWQHGWQEGTAIVQPALTDTGDVFTTAGDMMGGVGMRRLSVTAGADGWTVQERWTSRGLKPYFNDSVIHEGHAYGFDGTILSSISLEDGERKWKGGRYGAGQMILLADEDALLVLSEEGELALVSATPDKYRELARFKAIEGKTWNHPVLVGDVLLVRNGEEMAAFRLPVSR